MVPSVGNIPRQPAVEDIFVVILGPGNGTLVLLETCPCALLNRGHHKMDLFMEKNE